MVQSYEIFLYLCAVEWKIVHIEETDTTNRWLREQGSESDMVVWADYQTAGRGCGTNTWESERGQNLLFSVLLHPVGMPVSEQFRLSMAVSVALCEVLACRADGFTIKWPNDIYWLDYKICGMLIENRVQGSHIKDCIVGIGLNVNQKQFFSDAPNPISLSQIIGHDTDREQLLHEFLACLERVNACDTLAKDYANGLYRRGQWAEYVDETGCFKAMIDGVEDDGRLLLTDDAGRRRTYAFKEVKFII